MFAYFRHCIKALKLTVSLHFESNFISEIKLTLNFALYMLTHFFDCFADRRGEYLQVRYVHLFHAPAIAMADDWVLFYAVSAVELRTQLIAHVQYCFEKTYGSSYAMKCRCANEQRKHGKAVSVAHTPSTLESSRLCTLFPEVIVRTRSTAVASVKSIEYQFWACFMCVISHANDHWIDNFQIHNQCNAVALFHSSKCFQLKFKWAIIDK